MTGLVSARMSRALREGAPIALLVEIDHPDGLVHVWSHSGTLVYNGFDWIGIGVLGRITAPQQSTALAIQQVTFEMSGLPPSVDKWLGKKIKNRQGRAWLAAVKKQKVIDTFLVIDSVLDYATMKTDNDRSVTISITGNVGFVSIERAINLSWTHEWQQTQYPGDTGLSLIPQLTNKDSNWRVS